MTTIRMVREMPDWYLAAALRGVVTTVASTPVRNITDDFLVRLWHAYEAAAPRENADD